MLRPERMTSTSIICVRRDVEKVLEALSGFGEFQIEESVENTTADQYKQGIQLAEQSLANIKELSLHLQREKTGFLDIFKNQQPTKNSLTCENWQTLSETTSQEISTLKTEVEGLINNQDIIQKKTAELNHVKSMLLLIEKIGANLAAIEELKKIRVEIASLPQKHFVGLQTALKDYPIILNRCFLTKNSDFICLAMPAKHAGEVEKILKIHHAEIFQIPKELPHNTPAAIKEINCQLSENNHKEKTIQSALTKLGRENKHKLEQWRETTENILLQLQAKRKILQSGRLASVNGFVSQKNFGALTQKINSSLEGNALVLEKQVAPQDDPPTRISHNRYVKPFEEITKLYGLPHYDEVDPTPILAFTFPLIFGLMFGDIGHGLILLIGGLAMGFLIKGKSNQTIKNVCWILAACGAGAIFAGALFGEFFGIQLFAPLWFSPFDNVVSFLIFSLFVGVAQIMSGLVLEMANFALKRDWVDAALVSLPKISFYLGSVYMISAYQLNFGAWFSGPILFALIPLIVLLFGKPTFYALQKRSVGPSGERVSLGQSIFEGGDLVTRLLSNSISYTRILALLMAHWALIMVVYVIVGLVGTATPLGLILSGFIVVAGNIFVLALEGLIVFIHTLRLHFYEWFSKFYQGTGTPFSPYKQNFHHTKVVFQKKQAET
jgi:V/A-type H+/Na+-transporting ATPase subunit I